MVRPTRATRLGNMGNQTRLYSPVTLCNEWPTLTRLIFMVLSSALGSILNGFFVAAFFVENTLKQRGNVFHSGNGLTDLLITAGVMPVSAVVLLSGEWDTGPVCHALHFLTEASTNCYSLFYLLVVYENYLRVSISAVVYDKILSMSVGIISVMVFVVSFTVAGFGVYMSYDYDYCYRQHHGNITFRIATYAIFHIIPFFLIIIGFAATYIQIWRRGSTQVTYKRSQQYDRDSATTGLNLTVYCLYVIAWLPYLIVISGYPNTADKNYYLSVWFGISRSVLTSLLYSILNSNFRRAFANLFYYCCCKSTLSSSYNHRHRRTQVSHHTFSDVKVHIMHQVVNPNSHRGASSSREIQEL